MSMLAERKRKQKWCLNPRGKDWSEDSNKFGQKLLEKMGWSQGKGLGANEDGITEHVKVSYKHDNKGMGFREESDPWTENEAGFANLLKNLSSQQNQQTNSRSQLLSDGGSDNSECADVLNIQSLENKSKSSRARVHYRKFTRGKDLSRYSAKDLAQIFGKSSLNLQTPTSTSTIKSDEDQVTSTTSFGELTEEPSSENLSVSEINMAEYFLRKLPNRQLKPETVTSSEPDDHRSTEHDAGVVTTTYEKPAKSSKKKKKKSHSEMEEKPDSHELKPIIILKRIDSQETKNAQEIENGDGNIDNYYVENKKDRKKKKKHEKNEDSLKIKLKKKHIYDNPALNISETSNDIENNNINEVERKTKKKKKKRGIENPALELSNSDSSPTLSPKKKKRKTTFISYMNSESENTITVKSVPKKRKRSQDTEELGYDNPAFSHQQNITPKSALKKNSTKVRPRKSVQINESFNQEKFITDDSEVESQAEEDDDSLENTSISERIDNYQNELENSLNEKKCENGKDHTSKKFKNIALKRLSQRRASIGFPGVTHENLIKGYGNQH